ncbi:cofilin [Rhizophlyctis rosea]|nr:cofilin [Rhizophlyctis rosea]
MSSGVGVSSQAITAYDDLKLKRKYQWIVYKISEDGKEIIVDEALLFSDASDLGTTAAYDKFVSKFPEKEGRFAVIDIEFDAGSGDGNRSKLIFLMWAPTTCGIRQRMIYASSKLALRQRLDGIHTEVQATDAAELAFESVFEQIAPKLATPVIKPPKSSGAAPSADVEEVAEKVEKLDVKEEGEEKKEE